MSDKEPITFTAEKKYGYNSLGGGMAPLQLPVIFLPDHVPDGHYEVTLTPIEMPKKCLHCGGEAELEHRQRHDGVEYRVSCTRCMMQTEWWTKREAVVSAWNMR